MPLTYIQSDIDQKEHCYAMNTCTFMKIEKTNIQNHECRPLVV